MSPHNQGTEGPASGAYNVRTFFRTLTVILFCASCAWIVWRAVWLSHPAAYDTLRTHNIIEFLILTSGPFLAASLSLSALIRRTSQGYWTQFFVGTLVTVCFVGTWFASLLDALDKDQSEIPLVLAPALLAARLVLGLVSLVVPDTTFPWERERGQHRLIVASVLGTLLGLTLWSILNIPLVAWRAAAIAGADPYCLQVPADSAREAPVTHWEQLAGLRMRTPYELGGATAHEWQFSFHSVLVVRRGAKDEFYNWSYFSQNFVAIPEKTVRAVGVGADCEPKPGFFYTLAVF